MKIEIAKTAGFCMGVRRAVELAMKAPDNNQKPICTFGPLIHNPQVLNVLKSKGIEILTEVPDQAEGTVLIRAHGVPPSVKTILADAGLSIIDATCPRVIRVQVIIRKHARKGYDTIIVGDEDHPEVIGLLGYAGGRGHVVSTLEGLAALPLFERAIVVAQTTQNINDYDNIKRWVDDNLPHYQVYDTICDSTEKRQAEIKCLANLVDAVVVVGGKDSGNTQRLHEIAKAAGKPAFHAETEADLDIEALSQFGHVGVTAGASTPNWVIKKVCRAIEAIPYRGGASGWRGLFYRLQRTLLLTNVYVAIGAGCLTYACAKLQLLTGSRLFAAVAVLYVLSMHILNNLTGRSSDDYNDPDRAMFYRTHLPLLLSSSLIAGAAGLLIAYMIGTVPFWVLLSMSLLGLAYNMPILPSRLTRGHATRLKDIPGSKTVLIAVAWGLVTALLPGLYAGQGASLATIGVFAWATTMVFIRTAFFDLLDVQGDRIVGKETIPVFLGEKISLRLLKSLLGVACILLILLEFQENAPSLGLLLLLCPVALGSLVIAHEQGKFLPSIRLEFAVESVFVLSGLIGLFWALLQ
ncbi:MAG: 4-hydroxy-3-methylbut-2-enyl diphosphate reductase [Desulfobacterales bacterium]|jgi:4-hydroxy-3-methylbut-2-enyl diphosphate reductase